MQTYSHLWKGRIPWPSLACSYSSGHHNHDDTISIINQSHSRLIFRTTTWFQARTKGVIWKHGNEDCEKETTNLYELQINHCAPIISNDKHSVPPLCMLHHDLKNVLLIELWFIYLAAFLQFMNAHTHTYIYNKYIYKYDWLAVGCLKKTVSKTQKIQGTEDTKIVGSPELKSSSESCQLAIFRDIQHFVSIASAAASSSPETKLEEHCPSFTLKTQGN